MTNPIQPRRSVEQCEKDQSWVVRCDFNFIPAPQAVFGALFTLLTVLHVYLAIKYRKHGGIYSSLITASLWSAVGYWVKFGMGGPQPDGLGQMTTAYLLIFLAIFFINGYIYYNLRRLYIVYLPYRSIINSTALFWSINFFEFGDFVLQVLAFSFLFPYGLHTYESTIYLVTIFLFATFMIQIILYITVFMFLTLFLRAANKRRKAGTLLTQTHDLHGRGSIGANYKSLVIALYAATGLLTIRALYYIVNTGTPEDGFRAHPSYSIHRPSTDPVTNPYGYYDYISGSWGMKFHDPSQLGFDAAVVFLALLVLAWPKAHAARVLPRVEKKRRGRDVEGGRERVWTRNEMGLELNLQTPAEGRVEPPKNVVDWELTPDGRRPT